MANTRKNFTDAQKTRGALVSGLYRQLDSRTDEDQDSAIDSLDGLISNVYKKIIDTRVQILDKKNSINSRIITVNGKKVWLRDATAQVLLDANQTDTDVLKYNYARLFHAYVIGAAVIAKINKFTDAGLLQKLNDLANHEAITRIVNRPENEVLQCVSELKGELIKALSIAFGATTKKEDIDYFLDEAKNWAALEEPSMTVATVIKESAHFNNDPIVILDESCTELTEDQINLIKGRDIHHWYSVGLQDRPVQKALVDYYADKILEGNRVIPSQLRAILPLGKNTYRQSVHRIESETAPTELNAYYHTGTAAYLGKTSDPTNQHYLTEATLKQQKQHSRTDATIMIGLYSSLGDKIVGPFERMKGNSYSADDSTSNNLTYYAASAVDEIYYSKICLNGFRAIEANDYSGIKKILAIADATQRKTSNEQLRKLIDDTDNLIASMLTNFKDREVKGQSIIYNLTKIAKLNNELVIAANDKDLQTMAVWFGCASGENRTGITYYNALYQTLADASELPNKDNIYKLVANTQIIDIMTGFQGSTFGTEGIRGKSSGSLKPKHDRSLLKRTADFKKLPALDLEFNEALDALKKQLKTNNNVNAEPLRPMAAMLAARADRDKSSVVLMPEAERKAYVDGLKATTSILHNPYNNQAVSKLEKAAVAMNTHERFKPKPKPSRGMTVGGILLCLAGAALITVAVASFVATLGISSFMSAAIASLGAMMVADAIITSSAIGATVIGIGAVSVGATCSAVGFFRKDRGAAREVEIIKDSIPRIPRNSAYVPS